MPTEAERLEVEDVIHNAIGWALTKDVDRLFSIVVQVLPARLLLIPASH